MWSIGVSFGGTGGHIEDGECWGCQLLVSGQKDGRVAGAAGASASRKASLLAG
jgi:hypothetical protein